MPRNSTFPRFRPIRIHVTPGWLEGKGADVWVSWIGTESIKLLPYCLRPRTRQAPRRCRPWRRSSASGSPLFEAYRSLRQGTHAAHHCGAPDDPRPKRYPPLLGDGLTSSNPRIVAGVVEVLTQATTYDPNRLPRFLHGSPYCQIDAQQPAERSQSDAAARTLAAVSRRGAG